MAQISPSMAVRKAPRLLPLARHRLQWTTHSRSKRVWLRSATGRDLNDSPVSLRFHPVWAISKQGCCVRRKRCRQGVCIRATVAVLRKQLRGHSALSRPRLPRHLHAQRQAVGGHRSRRRTRSQVVSGRRLRRLCAAISERGQASSATSRNAPGTLIAWSEGVY